MISRESQPCLSFFDHLLYVLDSILFYSVLFCSVALNSAHSTYPSSHGVSLIVEARGYRLYLPYLLDNGWGFTYIYIHTYIHTYMHMHICIYTAFDRLGRKVNTLLPDIKPYRIISYRTVLQTTSYNLIISPPSIFHLPSSISYFPLSKTQIRKRNASFSFLFFSFLFFSSLLFSSLLFSSLSFLFIFL